MRPSFLTVGASSDERGGGQHHERHGDDAQREGTHQFLLHFDQGGVDVQTSTGMAKQVETRPIGLLLRFIVRRGLCRTGTRREYG